MRASVCAYFEVEGPRRDLVIDDVLRKRFALVSQSALFEGIHDETLSSSKRLRALMMTSAYVSSDHHDPAYEEMLKRLMTNGKGEEEESSALALARGAVMLAHHLGWRGLDLTLGDLADHAHSPILVGLASRALAAR